MMKKLTIRILPLLAAMSSLTACLKSGDANIPNDPSTSILEMRYTKSGGTTIGSGLEYFGDAALIYAPTDDPDTVSFAANIAGANAAGADVAFTVGADAQAINDNLANDGITYELMPDSLYKIINPTVTVKAGSRAAIYQIVFYPSRFNSTKTYMLPITVIDKKGYSISSNFGHIYFHAIGNPIAGAYKWGYQRWNDAIGAGAPPTSWTDEVATLLPDNPTQVEVQSGYGDQNGFNVRYVISFTNTNGVLSNPQVVINPNDISGNLTPAGISLTSAAKILTADLVNMHFKFTYQVTNSAGGVRTLIDEYTK